MILRIYEINPWIIIIISFLPFFAIGIISSLIAIQKGRNRSIWFILGLLNPIFVLLLLRLKYKKEFKDELIAGYRISLFIGLFFMTTILQLFILSITISNNDEVFKLFLPTNNIRFIIIFILAIIPLFGILYFHKLILGFSKKRPKIKMKVSQDSSEPIARLVSTHYIIYIIITSIAIYSFILTFFTNELFDGLILTIVMLIYFILFLPRYKKWKNYVENYEMLE